MSSESRRTGLECEAVNPKTGKVDLILTLSYDKIHSLRHKRNTGELMRAAELVRLTLRSPYSIFRGIRFDDDEKQSGNSPGWLCYCCRPPYDFSRDGKPTNAPPFQVFLVFVNEDGIIYDWRWDRADKDAFDKKQWLPVDYDNNRFQERII